MQKPHCRPWHSANACCTGPSEPSALVSPSTVVISQSTAETANIRHDRIGRPSTRIVQAPHTPCSQPTCVPVSPRSWRSASESSRRAGTETSWVTPLTDEAYVVELLGHAAASITRRVSTRTSWAR